jgi:acetyl esterase/lipase
LFSAEAMNTYGLDKRWAVLLNCVIALPEFRNSPEIKQPKGMEDVAASVRFLHENAANYGLDPSRQCLMGQSGGSFLSLGAAKVLQDAGEINKIKALFLKCPMIFNDFIDVADDDMLQWEKEYYLKE